MRNAPPFQAGLSSLVAAAAGLVLPYGWFSALYLLLEESEAMRGERRCVEFFSVACAPDSAVKLIY